LLKLTADIRRYTVFTKQCFLGYPVQLGQCFRSPRG